MTKAAVIGLGTMGPGIVATLARAGISVVAYDANPQQREKAAAGFALAARVLDNLGVATKAGGSMEVIDSLEACVPGADLVIENVPEKLELKIEVFQAIEKLAKADAVLASDTSGIPITKIQAGVKNPAQPFRIVMTWRPSIVPSNSKRKRCVSPCLKKCRRRMS